MIDIWQLSATNLVNLNCEGDIDVNHFFFKHSQAAKRSKRSPLELPSYVHGGHMGQRPSPAAELILKRENFDPDYFTWGGCMFVSERMRQAMALDPSEVRYFEVDDVQSTPLARSKIYRIMEPLGYEDMLDSEKSVYRMDSIPPPSEFGPNEIYKLVFNQDAAPARDLFYDSFFATLVLCTDNLAVRVLEAGCIGMEFTDPRGYRAGDVQRRRERGGVEMYGEKAETNPDEYRALLRSLGPAWDIMYRLTYPTESGREADKN